MKNLEFDCEPRARVPPYNNVSNICDFRAYKTSARAILILDEATSGIDPYSELVIQNALKNLLSNRLIIIAHRLSTIRLCDKIVVIDHGRIVERGTHGELMKAGGIYSSFYRMQFKEEEGINFEYGDLS